MTAPPAGVDPATWAAAIKVVGDRMLFHGDNANCTALGEDTADECAGDVLRAALKVLGGGETAEQAYRRGREEAAEAIVAHADKVAPHEPGHVPNQKRRWLMTAVQVAAPPITKRDVLDALRTGNYVACHATEPDEGTCP